MINEHSTLEEFMHATDDELAAAILLRKPTIVSRKHPMSEHVAFLRDFLLQEN
jgi:hypothetical protein